MSVWAYGVRVGMARKNRGFLVVVSGMCREKILATRKCYTVCFPFVQADRSVMLQLNG